MFEQIFIVRGEAQKPKSYKNVFYKKLVPNYDKLLSQSMQFVLYKAEHGHHSLKSYRVNSEK